MNIKRFSGCEDIYPTRIDGTGSWFYGQDTPCAEAYEVPEFGGKYPGTRLVIFNIDGTMYEPFKKEENVFIDTPVYSVESDSFAIIRYDFNVEMVELYEYLPLKNELKVLTEIEMKAVGDVASLYVITEPFTLQKDVYSKNMISFIWPFKKDIMLEENETFHSIDGDILYSSKWVEDPDYHEEVITRKLEDGSIISREAGFMVKMPDGSSWHMTE